MIFDEIDKEIYGRINSLGTTLKETKDEARKKELMAAAFELIKFRDWLVLFQQELLKEQESLNNESKLPWR